MDSSSSLPLPDESFPAPALYVVATPLGNLADIGLRAVACLRQADVIACEDTRHSRPLLDHYGLNAPCLALHDHNENEAAQRLLAELQKGKRVALITDAGTPGISDPGARAVAAVRAAGYAVVPLPGASAVIALLSVAGFTDAHFVFIGFLPPKQAARQAVLAQWRETPAVLVFYEAPHRIAETLADLAAVLGAEREIVVGRELTKRFEEIARMPLAATAAWLAADANRQRGEFVLAVAPPPPRSGIDAESERVLQLLAAHLPPKQAAALTAEIGGANKKALYERLLQIRQAAENRGAGRDA